MLCIRLIGKRKKIGSRTLKQWLAAEEGAGTVLLVGIVVA